MGRIFISELLKLWKNRLLLGLVLILCIVNGAICILVQQNNQGPYLRDYRDSYAKILTQLKGLPEKQALETVKRYLQEIEVYSAIRSAAEYEGSDAVILEMLQAIINNNPDIAKQYKEHGYVGYSGDMDADSIFYRTLLKELEHITGFEARIDKVAQQKEDMLGNPLFSNAFAQRNIIKTTEDYQKLKGLPLKLDNPFGLQELDGLFFTDLFALFLLLLLVFFLVGKEKSSDIMRLLRTTKKGRRPVMAAKIAVLILCCGVICLLLYGTNLFWISNQCGFGDLSRPIQSSSVFGDCPYPITVGDFLWLLLFQKFSALLLFGLFVMALGMTVKNANFLYLITGVILVAEYLLFALIAPNSYFNLAKYLNLFCLIDGVYLYQNYINLNILQHPVSLLTCTTICILAISLLLLLLLLVFMSNRLRFFTAYTMYRQKNKKEIGFRCVSLFYQENYKLFVIHKAGLVLLALLLFFNYALRETPRYVLSPEDQLYQRYLQLYQGPVDDGMTIRIQEENDRFLQEQSNLKAAVKAYEEGKLSQEELSAAQLRYTSIEDRYSAFKRVEEKFSSLKQISQKTGIGVYLLDDFGYSSLLGVRDNYRSDLKNACIMIALLCIFLPFVFSFENSNYTSGLLLSCKKGQQKTVRAKLLNSLLFLSLVFLLVQAAQFAQIHQMFSFKYWNAPVQSLPELMSFPWEITIWQFSLLASILRFFTLMFVSSAILCLSCFVHGQTPVILIGCVAFVIPVLLYLLGFDFMQYVVLLPVLSGNLALTKLNSAAVTQFFLVVIGTPFFLFLLQLRFLNSLLYRFRKTF